MKGLEAFLIALSALWTNKMRTVLTMLGIIIGISSVVTIVSLGDGTQASVNENFEQLGIHTVTFRYSRGVSLKPSDRFEEEDLDAIGQSIEGVSHLLPGVTTIGNLVGHLQDTSVTLEGSSFVGLEADQLTLTGGRFLTELDVLESKKTVVMGSDLAEEVFAGTQALGKSLLITVGESTQAFTVVGLYESSSEIDTGTLYAPYTTVLRLDSKASIQSIAVTFDEEVDLVAATSDVVGLLERRHENIGEGLYDSFSAESMMEMVSETMGTITLFIGAIAGISLLVGGIGVMNIMLVSVTERTREIGIRKALGAQHRDIMLQFLIEALTISLLGGVLGAGLGALLTTVGGQMMQVQAGLSVDALIMAFFFSVAIGLFFGIYPANRAAKLDPIVALRYE